MVEDNPMCNICREEEIDVNRLMRPCDCSGTVAYVHFDCLKLWVETRGFDVCGVCKKSYSGLDLVKKSRNIRSWIKEEKLCLPIAFICFFFFFLFYVSYIGLFHAILASKRGYKVNANIITFMTSNMIIITLLLIYISFCLILSEFKKWQKNHYNIVVFKRVSE
jgi:hypothetical protein